MNPEMAAINNLDSRKRGDDIKDTLDLLLPIYPKVAQIMDKISIKRADFIDLYGEESINRDNAYVAKREAQFAAEANDAGPNGLTKGETKKIGTIAEFQLIRGINMGMWLPGMCAQKTDPADDIGGGFDSVLEYHSEHTSSHIGLGVDVSFSHNLQDKYRRAKDDIDKFGTTTTDTSGRTTLNQLGKVKYYKSKESGFRGELTGLPRTVVALDLGIIEDLARTKNNNQLRVHIAKHTVILQIEHQLAVYADYAEKVNPACLDKILRAQTLIKMISKVTNSHEIVKQSGYHKNDQIEEAIDRGLALFR
ncbi:MAG: hypothetical protein AUK16_02525 [Parcubacteria group bacterium CG2_30_44_11]|nr:MAG: hypothetical protein AUK16_02525 [Parcubacteria group bacterium CG2_30_44_11]